MKNMLVAPVLKWVGGKRQLIDTLSPMLPKGITSYCEPFLGGGALLFHLQPNTATINDINADLMGVYAEIKNNVEELTTALNCAVASGIVADFIEDSDIVATVSGRMGSGEFSFNNLTCFTWEAIALLNAAPQQLKAG